MIRHIKILIFTAALMFVTYAKAQVKTVENFKIRNDSVSVFFYDPLISLAALDKDFTSKSDIEKSTELDKYLHNHALYLFRLTNNKKKQITFLCIRGDTLKQGTKMFYKVEVIKNEPSDFNPNTENYSDKISNVIYNVNCGGSLFENMSLFDDPEKKKYNGNGILFLGFYERVQPYPEIKASIIEIIKRL